MIGQSVGSYQIVGKIAVGGMGTVYRAEHTLIGRIAAVKILHPEMSASRDIVNRFFNEAKATTSIKHPGIVEVFDFGYLPSGHAYLVMEYLEGEPLSQRIKSRGRMPDGEAAMMMRGVCSALAAAHAKGIVHRDLKPDNIFLVADPDSPMGERAKILDFGIAKLTDIGLAGSATKTGAVMGTPTYMSPEQCKGTGNVDHRADLYSIGCILYELVSGRPPFVNHGAGELIGSHLFVEPDPVSRHVAISAELDRLIMCLLRKNPEERVQTSFALAQELVHVAQLQGWIAVSSTDPSSRSSMQQIMPPSASRPLTNPMFTPAPPMPTPHAHPYPAVAMAPRATELMPASLTPAPPFHAQKPTTLSGAASESQPSIGRPRKGLVVAIGAGLLAASIGIASFVALSGSDAVVPAAGTQPGAESDPDPTPAAPVAVPPPPVEPAPPVEPPAPDPVVEPAPPPPEKPPEEPEPTVTKKPSRPVSRKPERPVVKKPARPDPAPDKPAKPDQPDLLETEL